MRLTLREKELFEVIKQEPLISQEELARRFGITRSSVAVHISNLMKKGIILGKGYIFDESASAVVIGESCIYVDVQGENVNSSISIGLGGFAFDFSKALAKLGVNVKVITVIGNDEIGNEIINRLREIEIDTSYIYHHSKSRSCRRVSVNSKPVFNEIYNWKDYEKALALREWAAFNSEWLCIDPNFQENILKRLESKDEETLPYLCTYKVLQYPEDIPVFLGAYYTLVLGVSSESFEYYIEKIKPLANNQNWVITDGNSRVVYVKNQKVENVPLLPNQTFYMDKIPVLLAGLIYGLSSEYPLRQAIRIGIGFAAGE